MFFNSIDFAIFLLILLPLYWYIKDNTNRIILLLISSYMFYMSWNVSYIFLILFVTLTDYFAGRLIEKFQKKKKIVLIISIMMTLGLLFYFKYYNFFILNINVLTQYFFDFSFSKTRHALPIGISFYVFQSMSSTVDIYRGKIKAERSFIKYAFFVSFFPQLVAGPIVRASHFIKQIPKPKIFHEKIFYKGLFLIMIGLFKKVILADFLAVKIIDQVFSNPGNYSSLEALTALYGYAFQIYNDFSGYSDIAIGTALLFGYKLPLNFNIPYISKSIKEFWRRWHISLSTWIKDYVYISLGGNRGQLTKTILNLFVTWFLCGLWHGAAWNFVIWGLLHGGAIIIQVMWEKFHILQKILSGINVKPSVFRDNGLLKTITAGLKIFFTFHFVTFTWIIFRARDLTVFTEYLKTLTKMNPAFDLPLFSSALTVLGAAAILHFIPRKMKKFSEIGFIKSHFILKALFMVFMTFLIFYFSTVKSVPFIYFQF